MEICVRMLFKVYPRAYAILQGDSRVYGVRVFRKGYLRIYACLCVYRRVYGDLKEISRDRCWLQKVWYRSDRDHLAQVQGEQIIFQ